MTDQLPATPRRLGAEKLDATVLSAGYWLDSARIQHRKSEALMCAEESINHWKNAAYHFAEEHSKLGARIAELEREPVRLDQQNIELELRIVELERANAVLDGLCQERFDQLHEAAHKLATSRAAVIREIIAMWDAPYKLGFGSFIEQLRALLATPTSEGAERE